MTLIINYQKLLCFCQNIGINLNTRRKNTFYCILKITRRVPVVKQKLITCHEHYNPLNYFVWFLLLNLLLLCSGSQMIVCPLLAIVSSFLRLTGSDNPFGILNLFLIKCEYKNNQKLKFVSSYLKDIRSRINMFNCYSIQCIALRVIVMLFNATFSNMSVISWWSALLMQETRIPRKSTDRSQVTDKL